MSSYSVPEQQLPVEVDEDMPEKLAEMLGILKGPLANYDRKLPKLIESCLAMDKFQNTSCGKITLVLVCVPLGLGALVFFNVLTNALAPGIVLGIAYYVLNMISLFQPTTISQGLSGTFIPDS